uniref:Palmitoyltransferase n=1 Tax=Steinernema glaseri TaxID=37863 RepID=A0A1I7Y0L5_9BILA
MDMDSKYRGMLQVVNVFVFCGTILLVTLGAAVNVFHTCPTLYGSDACSGMTAWIVFFYLQAMVNLFLVCYTSRQNEVSLWIAKVSLSQNIMDRLKTCVVCCAPKPRRAYHCKLCNICVLRCDHHCLFAGACIGIANLRYFIVFLFWASIGIAYTSTHMYKYFNAYATRSEYLGSFGYFPPIVIGRALLDFEYFPTALVVSFLWTGIQVGISLFVLFIAQVYYLMTGFTTYEYHFLRGQSKNKLKGDGGSITDRLQLIFGHPWFLSFICPQPFRPSELTPEIISNLFSDGGEVKVV